MAISTRQPGVECRGPCELARLRSARSAPPCLRRRRHRRIRAVPAEHSQCQLPCVIAGFEQSPRRHRLPCSSRCRWTRRRRNDDTGGRDLQRRSVLAGRPHGHSERRIPIRRLEPERRGSQRVASTTVVMNTSQIVTATSSRVTARRRDAVDRPHATAASRSIRSTRRYVQTVTLKNNSSASITGPISLVLDQLTANVSLYNASGTTCPSVTSRQSVRRASTSTLAAGQSVAIQLQFTNAGNVTFTYDARVLAGPGSR